MIRKDTEVRSGLRTLNLTDEEIEVYMTLLRLPSTPLGLSRETGIKRTKIYTLLEMLEKRSLVTRQADDRGTFFVVTDPVNLGIQLSEREEKLKQQQHIFRQLVPMLNALQGSGQSGPFAVRTYEGIEGFKQMLWHEHKAKGEVLSLGGGDIEELIPDGAWAARHRQRAVEAGYRVREIINSEIDLPTSIDNREYLQRYICRGISAGIIPLENQITIYNETVAIYSWRHHKKMGLEIISRTFATTMRAMFEHFWSLTEATSSRS
jgi:predicted DNA-binding transcriptional regulator